MASALALLVGRQVCYLKLCCEYICADCFFYQNLASVLFFIPSTLSQFKLQDLCSET